MIDDAVKNFAAETRALVPQIGIIQIIHMYAQVIENNPDEVGYKNEFLRLIQTMNLRIISATLKSLITVCLADPATYFQHMGNAWYSLLLNDPTFKPFPKLVKTTKYNIFIKKITAAANAPLFQDPYFLYGIGRTTVPNYDFERFLTFLRRYMLEHRDASPLPPALPYVLARYAQKTGYIFFETDEEKALLAKLGTTEQDQILLACYRPILDADIVLNPSSAWQGFINDHRNELVALREEAATITPLTKIDDDISLLVKSQYEKYPYPAWQSVYPQRTGGIEDTMLFGTKARILVAGCGTGREAIELAILYPDANILAVDLSLSSLAYAQIKAREFNLTNINFQHADLLKLGETGLTFDFIASSGVLHHTKDPFKSWSVLESCLKPGGLMRICLYSEIGRWAINEARAVIDKNRYKPNDESMRDFRHDSKKLLKSRVWKKITNIYDYYYMSDFCDMLLHVQEHQFTVPKLVDHMSRLNLTFRGFYLPKSIKGLTGTYPVIEKYKRMFPADPHGLELINWDKFEQKNPDTFREMYQFWCQKT